MKNKAIAFYKGLTKKRNLRLLNTGLILLMLIYSVKAYLVKRDIREYLQKVEVLKSRQIGYIEGVSDGILGKNDKKIVEVLSEKVKN